MPPTRTEVLLVLVELLHRSHAFTIFASNSGDTIYCESGCYPIFAFNKAQNCVDAEFYLLSPVSLCNYAAMGCYVTASIYQYYMPSHIIIIFLLSTIENKGQCCTTEIRITKI